MVLEAQDALLESAASHVAKSHQGGICPCGRLERDGVLGKKGIKVGRRRRDPSTVPQETVGPVAGGG